MKDGEVIDGWWDIYPLDQRACVTSQSTGPNIQLASYHQLSVRGTFWFLVTCMSKLHLRPAMTWTAVSTIIRSHHQALGNPHDE